MRVAVWICAMGALNYVSGLPLAQLTVAAGQPAACVNSGQTCGTFTSGNRYCVGQNSGAGASTYPNNACVLSGSDGSGGSAWGTCGSLPTFQGIYNTSCSPDDTYACQAVEAWNGASLSFTSPLYRCMWTPFAHTSPQVASQSVLRAASARSSVGAPQQLGICALGYSQGGGDPCLYDYECAAIGCNNSIGACGVTRPGAACGPNSGSNLPCDSRYYCAATAFDTMTCQPKLVLGQVCPYPYNQGITPPPLDACASGLTCFTSSPTAANGVCVTTASLPTGTFVAISTNTPLGWLGLTFCQSGLLAPVVYSPITTTISLAQCVDKYDWSGVGGACAACPLSGGAYFGANGTNTLCEWDGYLQQCRSFPGVAGEVSHVVPAWADLMTCAASSTAVSTSGTACDTSALPAQLMAGNLQPLSCLYVRCNPQWSAVQTGMRTYNKVITPILKDYYPSCIIDAQAAAVQIAAASPCEVPLAWRANGWLCNNPPAQPPGSSPAGAIVGALFAVAALAGLGVAWYKRDSIRAWWAGRQTSATQQQSSPTRAAYAKSIAAGNAQNLSDDSYSMLVGTAGPTSSLLADESHYSSGENVTVPPTT